MEKDLILESFYGKPSYWVEAYKGKDYLGVYFPFSPELVEVMRNISGSRWDKEKKRWAVVPNAVNVEGILDLQTKGFEFSLGAIQKLEEISKFREQRLNGSKASDSDFEISGLGGELLPFQRAGVKYAFESKKCLIGDEMGLGKTVEALAVIQVSQSYPALVICPASLKLNWKREIEKWLPGKRVGVLNGKSTLIYSMDVVVINYEILGKWENDLLGYGFKAVVFDESHLLKNHKTIRAQTSKRIAKNIPIRLMLTGTPVLNRPFELVSQLDILGRLNDFGGFWIFAKKFCDAYKGYWGWDFSGSANSEELNEKLRSTCLRYDSLVYCRKGWVSIGDIVERRLAVDVGSISELGVFEFRRAVGFSKRFYQGPMVRIDCRGRVFYSTPDHRVWTPKGFKRADSLTIGDGVLVLREQGDPKMGWEGHGLKVLLSKLCRFGSVPEPGCYSKDEEHPFQSAGPRFGEALRMVWKEFWRFQCSALEAATILFSKLFGFVEADSSLCKGGSSKDEGRGRELASVSYRSKDNVGYCKKSGGCFTWEALVGGAQEKYFKGFKKISMDSQQGLPYFQGGKAVEGWVGLSRGMVGISFGGCPSQGEVQTRQHISVMVGSCSPSYEDSDRGGWINSPGANAEEERCVEGENAELFGLESAEILELGDQNRSLEGCSGGEYVYDIEVEGNHNFFVEGILVSNCYVRRTKDQVLPELPDKRRSEVPVELSDQGQYDRAESDLIQWIWEETLEGSAFEDSLVGLSKEEVRAERVRRADDAVYRAKQAEQLVRIEKLKQLAVRLKMDSVKEWVKNFLDSGEKLVLFSHHREVVAELGEEFEAPIILGGDAIESRQAVIDQFQNDPNCNLIVLGIKAGGVGITLTAASNVAFVELGWNPADHDQAEDRCHRIGQKSSVTVWYLLAENTIDREIWNLIQQKREVVNSVTEGKEEEIKGGILNGLVDYLKMKKKGVD